MRAAIRLVGSLLVALSASGLFALGATTLQPDALQSVRTLAAAPQANASGDRPASAPMTANAATSANAADQKPITGLTIPSIGLSADVVESQLEDISGGYTWQVPAFKVGHAEGTANAGAAGNAVLLGHVTSLHSGNVFQDLNRVAPGDAVQIRSNAELFTYTVVKTSAVPRSDSSVLQPTPNPTISLITCTGIWLPTIWDYTERLVVQAELSQ